MPFTEQELKEMREFDASLGDEDEDIELTEDEIQQASDRDTMVIATRFIVDKSETGQVSISDINREFQRRKRKKQVLTPEQKAKQAENRKKWADGHVDERREYRRRWYQQHKDHCKKKQKAWREANPEKVKDLRKSWSEKKKAGLLPKPVVDSEPAPPVEVPEEVKLAGDFCPIVINGRITPYMVSTNGVVVGNRGLVKHTLNNRKQHSVRLHFGGGDMKQIAVHRLMAEAFIPNPDGFKYVRFKNGDRNDLRVQNLEWFNNRPAISSDGEDSQIIHRVCNWISQGANLRTISYVTGLSYVYICRIAERTIQREISAQYKFPKSINY